MAKVKVEVLAEQLTYSYKNADGTHTREDYVRGQVLEMEEADAISASEGEAPQPARIMKNSAGTEVWSYPTKSRGVARAAVKILKEDAKVTAPVKTENIVPAPAPKHPAVEPGRV